MIEISRLVVCAHYGRMLSIKKMGKRKATVSCYHKLKYTFLLLSGRKSQCYFERFHWCWCWCYFCQQFLCKRCQMSEYNKYSIRSARNSQSVCCDCYCISQVFWHYFALFLSDFPQRRGFEYILALFILTFFFLGPFCAILSSLFLF